MYKQKLGIIGLGYWGPNLIRNLETLKDYCSLDMLCDINKDTLKRWKSQRRRLTVNYKEVCKNSSIDAVIISTPTSTHYEIIRYALEREKDVFCEKPLTNNLSQALEIASLAKQKKRVVMVGNVFVYHPAIRELKRRIDSGELGNIYEINSVRKGHGPIRTDVNVLWDLGSHDISILLYLIGSIPKKVCAVGFNYLPRRKLEDSVDLTLQFSEHIGARVNLSWLYPVKERKVIVVGNKKMAVFDDVNGIRPLTLYERSTTPFGERVSSDFGEFKMLISDGEITMPKIEVTEPIKAELQHFLDCLNTRKTPTSDTKNGCDIVRILERAQIALKEPGWIDIE